MPYAEGYYNPVSGIILLLNKLVALVFLLKFEVNVVHGTHSLPSCYCFQSAYWLVDFHLSSKSLKMSVYYSKVLLHNCRGCITNLDERLTKMHRPGDHRRHMNIYWICRILGGIVVPVSDIIIKKQTFCRVLVE